MQIQFNSQLMNTSKPTMMKPDYGYVNVRLYNKKNGYIFNKPNLIINR